MVRENNFLSFFDINKEKKMLLIYEFSTFSSFIFFLSTCTFSLSLLLEFSFRCFPTFSSTFFHSIFSFSAFSTKPLRGRS
jgi:hypothetical protein